MLPRRFQDVPKTPWKPSGAVLHASWSLWDRLLKIPGKLLERFWTVPEASRDLQERSKISKTLPKRPKTLPKPPASLQEASKLPPRGAHDGFGSPLEEQK